VRKVSSNKKDVSEALFVINKAAKRLTRVIYNNREREGKCSRNKLIDKQNALYEMKEKIIHSNLENGNIQGIGIHKRVNENCKENFLIYYRFGDYVFHLPAKQTDLSSLPFLGEYKKRSELSRHAISSMGVKKAKSILNMHIEKEVDCNSRTI
jgi:hypothetical protein